MAKLTHLLAKNAFVNKGFAIKGAGKHVKLAFVYKGNATPLQTTLRNSRDELDKGWIAGLKNHLKMPDSKFVVAFISCSKTEEDYIAHLMSTGEIDRL